MSESPENQPPLSGSVQAGPESFPVAVFDALPAESADVIEVNALNADAPLFLPGCLTRKSAMVCRILAQEIPAGTTLTPGTEVVARLTRGGVTTSHPCQIVKKADAAVSVDGVDCAAFALTLQPLD